MERKIENECVMDAKNSSDIEKVEKLTKINERLAKELDIQIEKPKEIKVKEEQYNENELDLKEVLKRIENFTIDNLKQALRILNERVSGSKSALLQRLKDCLKENPVKVYSVVMKIKLKNKKTSVTDKRKLSNESLICEDTPSHPKELNNSMDECNTLEKDQSSNMNKNQISNHESPCTIKSSVIPTTNDTIQNQIMDNLYSMLENERIKILFTEWIKEKMYHFVDISSDRILNTTKESDKKENSIADTNIISDKSLNSINMQLNQKGKRKIKMENSNRELKKVKTNVLIGSRIPESYARDRRAFWDNTLRTSIRAKSEEKIFLVPYYGKSREEMQSYKQRFRSTFFCPGRNYLDVNEGKSTTIKTNTDCNETQCHWFINSRHGVKRACYKTPTLLWHLRKFSNI